MIQISSYFYLFSVLILVLINLLIYFDRGAIAATASLISDTFELGTVEEGIISSAFMVGYVLCSPLFAQLPSCLGNSKFVIIFGLGVWVCACLVLMISHWIPGKFGYAALLIGRILAGIGESAFAPLAPTILDDISPVKWSTTIITLYFACIPVGIALGYGVAGGIGEFIGWQWVFLVQALLMLALLIPTCCAPTRMHPTKLALNEEHARKSDQGGASTEELFQIRESSEKQMKREKKKTRNIFLNMFQLVKNPIYMFNVLGGTVYTGVIGALAFWGPSFFSEHLEIDLFYANLTFSVLSVVIGLSATWVGGAMLSCLIGNRERNVALIKGRKTSYSLLCCFLCLTLAAPLGLVAFVSTNTYVCFTAIAIGEFFLFMITSPMNVSILSSVPDTLRDFAMSVDIFLIHFLGDFPSPSLVGAAASVLEKAIASYHDGDTLGGRTNKQIAFAITMGFLWSFLALGIVFFFVAWFLSFRKYRKESRMEKYQEIEVDISDDELQSTRD
uniref:Major facilitator superfamily (MFS) profile domain-containing protein n=1 Tax=Percolomonas cosmopolitus TaxID=63605 RepID=A0A7S1KNW3_9EUKA|mmetsp:Transcript_11485/g.43110  ORF Transcript_11485/g.43110 Transcript_11485/m.43110 type:complete len:503 (+) Transcript_11485:178-1686(+)